jgi:hypothetical protein
MKSITRYTTLRDLAVASLLLTLYSCNFAQSVEKDLLTGLTSRGNGLSCDKVYLSDGEDIIERNVFIYGEKFYVNFDGMNGFEKEGKAVFPDMQLVVAGKQGDTALYLNDLYADYKDGIEYDPLQLYAEVTVADPMHSGADYTLYVNIGDKRGDGTFKVSLDFSISRDHKIKVAGDVLSSKEIYLFSQTRGHTIADGKIAFNETIYLLFEGLEGFSVQNGQVQLGLSMLVKDADGNIILDESDLFGDGVLSYDDVHNQVAPNLILTGTQIANPVSCVIRIWDKRSSAWISASTELVVE